MARTDSSPDLVGELAEDNRELRRKLDTIYYRYVRLVEWKDCVTEAMHNEKFSPYYLRMYMALINAHPELLQGDESDLQVKLLRADAGGIGAPTATRFFRDMSMIGAFEYSSGEPVGNGRTFEARIGHIKPNPSIFPHPELFDTNALDRKRKAKEAEAKRRSQFIDPRQLFECEICGSKHLVYSATAVCLDCHHVHEPIINIPVDQIVIKGEVVEIIEEGDYTDEGPTLILTAIRPPVAQQLPMVEPPRPRSLPARPDEKCIKCGRLRRDCFENSEGTWWYSCTPQMWDEYEKRKGPHQ